MIPAYEPGRSSGRPRTSWRVGHLSGSSRPTSWQVRSLGSGPPTEGWLRSQERRRAPRPAGPLIVGYVPTTIHAHRPHPQIPARVIPARWREHEPDAPASAPPPARPRSPAGRQPAPEPEPSPSAEPAAGVVIDPAGPRDSDVTEPAAGVVVDPAGPRDSDVAEPAVGDVVDPVGSAETDAVEGFAAALHRHLSRPTGRTTFEDDTGEMSTDDDLADKAEPDRPGTEGTEHARPEATGAGPERPEARGTEHGDRGQFLFGARNRLAGGIPHNQVHPPPIWPHDAGDDEPYQVVPEPDYANLDRDDLFGTFMRAVEEAGGVCHRIEGDVPDTLLDQLVTELNAWEIVVSAEPEAAELGERLASRGVEVAQATPEAAANAALGVTSAIAGIAATGSVVLDSRRAGGRLASLLPAAHLCVLPIDRLVATPGDFLRTLGDDPDALPSALVVETGPSRTGDIEQILTLGAHGPTRLHIIVVG